MQGFRYLRVYRISYAISNWFRSSGISSCLCWRFGGGSPVKDLRYRTMPEIASQSIKRAILEGKIKPGEQLRQDALASRFGFSRSPIREALLCLEAAGLVTFEPHRGV